MAPTQERFLLSKARFDAFVQILRADGYEVVGPRIEQQAIVYGPISSAVELPIGWTDRQSPGNYRLEKRGDETYFGFAVGPHSWKKYLFPPRLLLWQGQRSEGGFNVQASEPDPPPRAFLGMRSCELHALAIQDRVFLNRDGRFTDPHYDRARQRLMLIAVECQHPADTCFCTSMGTGPEVNAARVPVLASKHADGALQAGSSRQRQSLPMAPVPARQQSEQPSCDIVLTDVVLTELDDAFVVRALSEAGQSLVERLQLPPATADQIEESQRRVQHAANTMKKQVDVEGVRELLHGNLKNARWQEVAQRCLACTNCTLVCPTCFCSSVEDVNDLNLEHVERHRVWDSCFNPEFGRVHGGNFRPGVTGRYRQWLTHKFASWFDQFDVSGCVGCGRCITWCPVGIDVTEEISAIRATDVRAPHPAEKSS